MEKFMYYYFVFDLAFVILSWFTILFPAYRLASERAEVSWLTKFVHFVVYSFLVFILFPITMPLFIANTRMAVEGYANGIVRD